MRHGAGVWFGLSVLWLPLAFLFDGVTVLMLPLRVGGDATILGMVSLVGLGLAAGVQPVAGWMSDRLRDRVDRRFFAAAAAIPAILGLWLLVTTSGLAGALIGYVAIQLAAATMQAGQQTLIPEHLEPSEQGRGAGLKAAFDVGGSFLAFALLGALLAAGGLAPAATLTVLVVVVAAVLMIVLVPGNERVAAVRSTRPRLAEGLVTLIVSRFLFLFATYGVGRFLLLLVAERTGLDPAAAADEAGGLLAVLALATAVAAIPAGWLADRWARRDLMIGGACIASVGILLLVPAAGLVGVAAGGLLMAVGTAAFVTANWAATTALVPREDSGRSMGIANLGTGLAAAAAGALGPVVDGLGFGPTLVVAAVASAAAALPLVVHPERAATRTESTA